MFPLLKYTKEQIESYFAQVTPEMVQATLGRGKLGFFDLLNLISPAAYPFMDAMRARAQKARRRYYGKTVSVYAPLYIGNTCVNSCRYCDFRIQHTGTVRRNLSLDEIRREAEAIRASGIDLLLNTIGFNAMLNNCSLVITGEGSADRQTLMGKLPFGILQRTKRKGIPTILIAGQVSDKEQLLCEGFSRAECIHPQALPLEEAMKPETAKTNIKQTLALLLKK